ncbi:NAD(P)H-dependent oxidoreductase [Propioniciclava flava]
MSYLLVISAGMGTPSSSRMLGDRLAAATVEAQSVRSEIKVLELRDVAVDLAHFYTSHVPSRALQDAFDLVGKASGVIAVSPVLNAGVNGLFKLFFDLLDEGVMAGGRPGAAGRDGGLGAAQPGDRQRDAAAVLLPEGDGGAASCLRRDRRLGFGRIGPGPTDRRRGARVRGVGAGASGHGLRRRVRRRARFRVLAGSGVLVSPGRVVSSRRLRL